MVNWDDATDKKFLLNIIHVLGPEKMNWAAIMASMGDEYTLESVKSRYKKLKQQAKLQFGDPPTPASGKAKASKGEKSTGTKRKQKKDVAAVEDGYNDDDEEQTPSKKMKAKEEAEEEMKVKKEAADESEAELN